MPAAQRTTYLQALVGNLVRPPLLLSRHAVERESTSEGACVRERELQAAERLPSRGAEFLEDLSLRNPKRFYSSSHRYSHYWYISERILQLPDSHDEKLRRWSTRWPKRWSSSTTFLPLSSFLSSFPLRSSVAKFLEKASSRSVRGSVRAHGRWSEA
jgi:hypothetical protein